MSNSFDYTRALRVVCRDICAKVGAFRGVDLDRVGFSFTVARDATSRYGRWASTTPLRFHDGLLVDARKRRRIAFVDGARRLVYETVYYKTPVVKGPDGTDLLYVIDVMAPRFLNLTVKEKIVTLAHELYHIDPRFNGDLRRFHGRNWQHGVKKRYDARCEALANEWLATDPDPRTYEFLKYNLDELTRIVGRVVGCKFPRIKLIPISEEEARRLEPRLFQRPQASTPQ